MLVSLTTISENAARFLMFFGFFAVLTLLGGGIVQATLVADVYDNPEAFEVNEQGQPDPATFTDAEVRANWQDAQTLDAWEQPLAFLGLGSLLASIILTFAISIYRGVKVMGEALPQFWRFQLARWTGQDTPVPRKVEDEVPLPFGGGV